MIFLPKNNFQRQVKFGGPPGIKINIFKTLIEPILLYGCEIWTLSSKQHARLDGAYTKLLMRIKCLSWKRHPTIQQIYGDLPRVSTIVRSRRLQFAGHFILASSFSFSTTQRFLPYDFDSCN